METLGTKFYQKIGKNWKILGKSTKNYRKIWETILKNQTRPNSPDRQNLDRAKMFTTKTGTPQDKDHGRVTTLLVARD